MISFLNEHGRTFKDAFFINLDNCGTGTPIYASLEGMLLPHKPHPDLIRLARQVLEQNTDLNVKECPFRAGFTDGSAAMVRGYKVLSILALDDDGVIPNWHWYNDVPENVQEEKLETVEAFTNSLKNL